MNKPLAGRVALVTGGSRGIGRAIALHLAEQGADVAINYEKAAGAAEEVAELARRHGARAITIQGSVASFEDCQRIVQTTVDQLGSLGILINNAGIMGYGNYLADVSVEEMHKVLGTNLFGCFYMSKCAVPHLRKAARSDIIFISTYAVTIYPRGNGPYNVSKSAIESFAFTMAKEERQHGIRINIVSPNLTLTDMMLPMAKDFFGVNDLKDLDERSPFGRVGTSEDIASVVGYFVSPANEYVSGQRVVVDGATDAGVIAGRSV
jgi:NAD(P)-dependent dehydrogenase (short-subunit alcohol dehydrogenase family)